MKKKLIPVILLLVLLTGCTKSSDSLLSYSDTNKIEEYDMANYTNIDEADYFAKDLAIISDKDDHMVDTDISATSTLIINTSDNKMIYANNVYKRMYPASLTKLITALVVLQNANLNDSVTISYEASHITESGAKLCGFKEGDKVSMLTLLNSLLVYSGNDAGVAIAEHVGGSLEGFAKMMNETAKNVGAVHSNFINPHGLHDDNHYTTAYDLYLIFNELLEYDQFVSIINQASYTATYENSSGEVVSSEFLTTNRYLKGTEDAPEGITVVGGKTGTTASAGSCLILYSKDDKNKSYITLVLHADSGNSLFAQMSHLLQKIE